MLQPAARQSRIWMLLRQRILAQAGTPASAADVILRHFHVDAPPVVVEQIVCSMGVLLERVQQTSWSGAANSTSTAAKIWLRGTDAPVRQRFTLAHELGHLMLHETGVAYRDDTFSGGWREAQANQFAAALLVPQRMLRTRYPGRASVLAKTFDVSEPAMKVQISNLTGTPIEAVY